MSILHRFASRSASISSTATIIRLALPSSSSLQPAQRSISHHTARYASSSTATTSTTPNALKSATAAASSKVHSSASSTPTASSSSSSSTRPHITSAQLRAQRPRAAKSVAANPDTSLNTDKCGPAPQAEPEMVSIVNESTGERLGPRGLEPTRYGDWEAKGRCWDF